MAAAALSVETLFHQYGVDLALFGHVHDYSRFLPVYNHTVRPGKTSPYVDPEVVHCLAALLAWLPPRFARSWLPARADHNHRVRGGCSQATVYFTIGGAGNPEMPQPPRSKCSAWDTGCTGISTWSPWGVCESGYFPKCPNFNFGR